MRILLVPLVPVVVLASLALAGCDDSSDEPVADPTEAALSSMASRMSEATKPVDTDVPHPCDVVSAAAVGRLVGATVTTSRLPATGQASLMTCTYSSTDPDVPIVTLQTTLDGGSVQDFLRLTLVGGGHATELDLPGADDAAMVVDDDPKFPTATAVASVDGTLMASIAGGVGGSAPTDLARDTLALLAAG